MFDKNKEKQFVLQLFNLEYSGVQDVSCIRTGNTVIIDITLASDPVPCPVCGCAQPHIKNYVPKNITHSFLSDRRCTLRYHVNTGEQTQETISFHHLLTATSLAYFYFRIRFCQKLCVRKQFGVENRIA